MGPDRYAQQGTTYTFMKRKTIIISIIVILILIGVATFLFIPHGSPSVVPNNAPIQSNAEVSPTSNSVNTKPVVTSPQSNSKIKSPLVVKGNIPPGWMFEGVFPIKLLDSNRKIIVQTQAKESVPGTWNSGKNVEFSAKLIFSTQEKSGFVVLEKDNPSGLPENAESFEVPINF